MEDQDLFTVNCTKVDSCLYDFLKNSFRYNIRYVVARNFDFNLFLFFGQSFTLNWPKKQQKPLKIWQLHIVNNTYIPPNEKLSHLHCPIPQKTNGLILGHNFSPGNRAKKKPMY